MEEMLNKAEINPESYIIIENNNCSSHYKSAPHFCNLQEMSNKYDTKIIRAYSKAGHWKGQTDHVGGLVKVAMREIGAGAFFANSKGMVNF